MWLSELVLVSAVATVTWAAAIDPTQPLEKEEIIERVNSARTTWTAGRNFHPSLTKNYLQNLLGAKTSPGGSRLPKYVPVESKANNKLPKNFDLRTEYPNCTGLNTLRDQGPCGSCWAVAAASAFTDRLCIKTKGAWNGQLSAENVMSCCSVCGKGCKGGHSDLTWEFFADSGIVTGGDYHSEEGCEPYPYPPCEHHVTGPRKKCSAYVHPPKPVKCAVPYKCRNKSYKIPYTSDIHTVKYPWTLKNESKTAMKEIHKNGPLEASFDVYEDFLSYKSGVYQHITGAHLGRHAVKIIGWGVEKGTKYWLVANSWNSDWGDKGYFKIIRGVDSCGFEENINGADL